ncbi:MAG: Hsp20 family protein [Bacteriovoracaceae bacterium]|jgi:HSP20 family molecular chaperone IbpA|nr:Hsp20 family protein [Bacteriovoracaceae bacterium]
MNKFFSSKPILVLGAFLIGSAVTLFSQNYFKKEAQDFTDRVHISASAADKIFQRKKRRAVQAIDRLRNKIAVNPQAKMKTLANKMDMMFHKNFPSFDRPANENIEITESEDSNYKYFLIAGKGYNKESINIKIGDGMVTLSGETMKEEKSQGSSMRSISKFNQSFNIPYGVNADLATFEVLNDKLMIKFPKRS